jgi:hypothetical protein
MLDCIRYEGIQGGRRKPYEFYNTFIIPGPEDGPLRGSKHVAWLKYTNVNCIFNIVVLEGYPSSYSTSKCFGNVCCPSPGGIRCICTAVGTCYKFTFTGCCPSQEFTQMPEVGWKYDTVSHTCRPDGKSKFLKPKSRHNKVWSSCIWVYFFNIFRFLRILVLTV